MCKYVTLVLPKQVDLQKALPVFEKYEMNQELCKPDLSVETKDLIFLLPTTKMCDCGSVIGVNAYENFLHKNEPNIDKLKKKGWSNTKIERWLQEKENHKNDYSADSQRWIDFLKTMLYENLTPKASLFFHDYRGQIADEKIQLKEKVILPIESVSSQTLEDIQPDTLYVFIK